MSYSAQRHCYRPSGRRNGEGQQRPGMNSSGAETQTVSNLPWYSDLSSISDVEEPENLVVDARAITLSHNCYDSAFPFPLHLSHICPRFMTLTTYSSFAFGHLH